jgi:tetratricopeptide (TPR) repeat protein/DNA-binding winged helix-turn-helix (wHTH) protein
MQSRVHRIYRLDSIEIDTSRLCLKRDGHEQHLRQKTFQVLIYLLEHRQRLITKEELFRDIWLNTAVTDNTVEQCLAEIRKILGDDPRRPRFIKTIPRAGYRFIGEVDETDITTAVGTDHGRGGQAQAEEKSQEAEPETSSLGQRSTSASWLTRRLVLISLAFILIFGAILFTLVRARRASEGPNRDVKLAQAPGKVPVAVMFFDNRSGSADLDWLREGVADMLITGLSNSKQLTVLSREQLHLLVQRSGHDHSKRISLDLALDLARLSQAKIVILGSFVKLDGRLRIDVQLHDASDGQMLAAEALVVEKPGEILTQIDLLSLKLASHLGETGDAETNIGLATVTTNNLEAYRFYSLGVEKSQAFHNREAIALFEQAIALDPEFAMAHARIGFTYAVSWGRVAEGKPHLERAFKLTNRLSEKDKLNISSWYALANLDYSGAIKAFREILTLYPLDVDAYRRLGNLLRGENRLDEAIEVIKQGLVVDGRAPELYNSLGSAYSEAGRHDEAIAMFQRYVALAPNEANAHDSLGGGFQWAGRYSEAIQAYERARELKSDFEIPIIHLANVYFQQGRYREATKQYQRYIQMAPSNVERYRGYTSIAWVHRAGNRPAEAALAANQSMKQNPLAGAGQMFLVALDRGDLTAAGNFLQKYLASDQHINRGSRGNVRELYFFRGQLALKSGRAAEAIEKFRETLKHRPAIWHITAFEDCLANAYLELGRLDEAISEYERILRLNPNYPLVQYHLAQAYERKGINDRALAAYRRFLQIWKDADAEVPQVLDARERLKRVVGLTLFLQCHHTRAVRQRATESQWCAYFILRCTRYLGFARKPRLRGAKANECIKQSRSEPNAS